MDNLLELVNAPWEYLTEIELQNGYPFAKYHRLKIGNETLTIDCHGVDWAGEAKIAAIARLMAAAPDMYEALKRLVGYGNVFTYKAGERNPYEQAMEALARTEGMSADG